MENTGVWTPEAREAFKAVVAAVAALADVDRGESGSADSGGADATASDPLRDLYDGSLNGLTGVARLDASTAALKVHLTAGCSTAFKSMASPSASAQFQITQEMSLVSEVACALTVSERSAGTLLAETQSLTTELPLTLSALQEGSISWQHARVMVDETSNLDPAGAATLEAHFLDTDAENPAVGCPAGEMVPGRFRHKARTWRERHHAESIEKRHKKCAADRRLEYAPDRDGMAWLSAYLPADQAAGIWNSTTAAARALQCPDEPRTLPQLRADVAAKLLLSAGSDVTATTSPDRASDSGAFPVGAAADGAAGGVAVVAAGLAGDVPIPAAQVLVTVPVFALMGLTDETAMLDAYGPIPASMARSLVAEGASSFYRVLTDPRDGAPLEIGRDSYRIPSAMRRWLRLRDGKCPFPGCSNQSLDNEADHILAWARGGTTGISNL
ncbi:MAG TPA: DUF222 domain-containing protein, partial [Arthrobacter sp.]|nr:DUF222 domain-containing protein [Arthrobacter sp.]